MLMNIPKAVFGDLVLKCQLGKPFDGLRSIMKKENIDELFKKSCSVHFLELSGPRPLRFSMIMVYGLLRHRIKYARNDGGPKEGRKKMDEVWINYCGMQVCFGLKEFATVTGLRCGRPEERPIKKTPHKRSNKCKVKKDELLGIVGPSYKVENLMADLKNKDIPKHYREKLCLVWFVHSVLLARDVKKVIEHDLLALANDFGKFNDYPRGYEIHYLTVKYLYGFLWVFMDWVCEVIPPLRKHFKDYPNKVSHPRILRWLAAVESSKTNNNEADLFNPSDDVVVHPWIPNVKALHVQPKTTTDLGAFSGGVAGGVVCDGSSHLSVAFAASRDYKCVGAQKKFNMFENAPCTGPPSHPYTGPSHPYSGLSHSFSPSCSYWKCKVCKDREDKLLEKLEAITKDVEELKSRKGVIPSNEGPPKKVDIFAVLGKEKKKDLEEFIKMKVQKEYTMHSFAAKDFSNMTNMYVWYKDKYIDEILCLMRGRQLAYSDAYNVADRIMDLNFYNNFKDKYAKLCKIANSGGLGFDQLVSTFQWDEEAIKYVREKRSYPHGKSWTKAKRILAIINMDVTYFLTVEILLYEGMIKVYDCNLPVFSEKTFLTHMKPLLKLLPKLLTQSKLMDHLSAEVLAKESWDFKGQNKNIQLSINTTGTACEPYSVAYMSVS
ncbi:hypothetical protein P3S67_023289 [Capsicum chacoense]